MTNKSDSSQPVSNIDQETRANPSTEFPKAGFYDSKSYCSTFFKVEDGLDFVPSPAKGKTSLPFPMVASAWQLHLTRFRAAHPTLSLKEAMQAASHTYKEASRTYKEASHTYKAASHAQKATGAKKTTSKPPTKPPTKNFNQNPNQSVAQACPALSQRTPRSVVHGRTAEGRTVVPISKVR